MLPLILKSKPRHTQKTPLVVTVSGKVSQKAIERNIIKRRIRVIMRPAIKETNKAYTVIVKPEAKELTFQELKNLIENQIQVKKQ